MSWNTAGGPTIRHQHMMHLVKHGCYAAYSPIINVILRVGSRSKILTTLGVGGWEIDRLAPECMIADNCPQLLGTERCNTVQTISTKSCANWQPFGRIADGT